MKTKINTFRTCTCAQAAPVSMSPRASPPTLKPSMLASPSPLSLPPSSTLTRWKIDSQVQNGSDTWTVVLNNIMDSGQVKDDQDRNKIGKSSSKGQILGLLIWTTFSVDIHYKFYETITIIKSWQDSAVTALMSTDTWIGLNDIYYIIYCILSKRFELHRWTFVLIFFLVIRIERHRKRRHLCVGWDQ